MFQSHVHQGNLYLDLENYDVTEQKQNPKYKYTVYALDTESVSSELIICCITWLKLFTKSLNEIYT